MQAFRQVDALNYFFRPRYARVWIWLWGLWWYGSPWQSHGANKTQMIATYDGVILKGQDMSTTYTEQGKLKATIQAPQVLQYDNQNEAYPQGVDITLYNEKAEKKALIHANTLHFIAKDNLYKAEGNVCLENLTKKQQLYTEALDCKKLDITEITTDKFVRIETEDETLMGYGVVIKDDQYQLKNPTGVITMEEVSIDPDLKKMKKNTLSKQQDWQKNIQKDLEEVILPSDMPPTTNNEHPDHHNPTTDIPSDTMTDASSPIVEIPADVAKKQA